MKAKAFDTRRAFLARVTATLGALASAAAVVPGLGLLLAPLRKLTVREPAALVRVASEHEVRPDKPLRVTAVGEHQDAWLRLDHVALGSCWLVRADEAAPVRAFSTVCPHLGCGVDYDDNSAQVRLPLPRLLLRPVRAAACRARRRAASTSWTSRPRGASCGCAMQRFRTGTSSKEPIG